MITLRGMLVCTALGCGQFLVYSTAPGGELKELFYQNFQSPNFPPSTVLGIANGEGEQKIVRRESSGVRILVSGKPSGFPPFGVAPRFRISGDFEITASYELLKLDKPASGYGVSVSLWAMTDTPSVDAATVSRAHRPWDGNVWVADKGWWDVSEKKYNHDGQASPTQSKAGKLRLVRMGPVMHYLVADGDSDEFRELRQVSFNEEDISQIFVGVDTGGSHGPVEVLLKDLRIHAEELPMGASKRQTSRAWIIWLAMGIFGTAGVAVSVLFLWKSAQARRTAHKLAEPVSRLRKPKA